MAYCRFKFMLLSCSKLGFRLWFLVENQVYDEVYDQSLNRKGLKLLAISCRWSKPGSRHDRSDFKRYHPCYILSFSHYLTIALQVSLIRWLAARGALKYKGSWPQIYTSLLWFNKNKLSATCSTRRSQSPNTLRFRKYLLLQQAQCSILVNTD